MRRLSRTHWLGRLGLAALGCGLLALAGCSGSDNSPIAPPSFSPADAAQEAMALYDTNKDGYLDADELKHCPSLLSSFALYDQNGDKKLSLSELTSRFDQHQKRSVGSVAVNCLVLFNGAALTDAEVTFVPERFLGPDFKRALGKTNIYGVAEIVAEDHSLPGCRYGLYRVEISKKNSAGQEILAARYNSQTTLGAEVSVIDRTHPIRFQLTGR